MIKKARKRFLHRAIATTVALFCFIPALGSAREYTLLLTVSYEFGSKTFALSDLSIIEGTAHVDTFQPESHGYTLSLLSSKGDELFTYAFSEPRPVSDIDPNTFKVLPLVFEIPYLLDGATVRIRDPEDKTVLSASVPPLEQLVDAALEGAAEAQQTRSLTTAPPAAATSSSQSTQNQDVQNKNSAAITALIVVVLGLGVVLLLIAIFLAMRKK